jgi:hypothetical protein
MKQVFAIFFILISSSNLIAQNNVEIKLSEASVIFSIGPQPAISSEFVNVSQKELMKAFEKYMKNYKAKTKSSKRETIATGAQIKTISTGLINVYCAYKEETRGNKITAYFAFDLGNVFVSSASHPIEYQAARQFVYDFSFKFYRDLNEQKVQNANKDLKKLLSNEEKLKKEKKQLEQTIAKKKDEIRRAELLLNKNAKNQELILKAIEEQKLFIQKIEEEGKAIK